MKVGARMEVNLPLVCISTVSIVKLNLYHVKIPTVMTLNILFLSVLSFFF